MSEVHDVEESGPDRRSLIKAAAVIAIPVAGASVVAACSSSNSKQAPNNSGSSSSGGGLSVPVANVPVGGGFVNTDARVVVTQPSAGTFKAFSAVCTHQGCTVNEVSNNQIHCPCHGSIFNATDGSVVNGPATSPLSTLNVAVTGANVEVTGSAS